MKHKTKKFFSALLALVMALSLCTFALADETVALAAGSDAGGNFSAVSGIDAAPAALAGAEVAYTVDSETYAFTATINVDGYTAAFNEDASVLTITETASSTDYAFTLTFGDDPSFTDGTITLGAEAPEEPETSDTVALRPGSDAGGNFSAVSGIDAAPAALAGAEVAYTVDSETYAFTATINVDGYTAAFNEDASVLTITETASSTDYAFTLTFGDDPSFTDGTITLGAASVGGETRPEVPANTDGQFNSYASDTADGTVSNEGATPPDVIDVVVPTDAQSTNAFDLYLDPHDLLKETSGARYGDSVTLTGNSKVYFKTSENTFANESKSLTITNKSSVPVGVDLTVDAAKGNNDFTFVDSTSAVDSAEGAAIYLAIKSGTKTGVVSDTATDGINSGAVATFIDTDEDWYEMKWHGSQEQGYYQWDMVEVPDGGDPLVFKDMSFNLTAKINDKDAWDSIDSFDLSVTWDVKKYEASSDDNTSDEPSTPSEPTVEDADPDAEVTTAFSSATSTLVISLDWGAGAKAKTHAVLTTQNANLNALESTTVDAPATEMSVTTNTSVMNAVAYRNLNASATVTFYNDSADEADAVVVNVTIK